MLTFSRMLMAYQLVLRVFVKIFVSVFSNSFLESGVGYSRTAQTMVDLRVNVSF